MAAIIVVMEDKKNPNSWL